MDATALLCNICPKRPTFSDVSHLLTHVSSKAHLANYFKLQVRSHQEPGAGDLLEEYNLWYKANNLPRLLSDRMASKEARKRSKGKNASDCPVLKKIKKQAASKEVDPSPPESLSTFLDPQLSDPYLNMDGDSMLSESYIAPGSPHQPQSKPWKDEYESESEDGSGSFLQTIPIWDGRLRNLSGTSFPLVDRAVSYDPFVDDKDPLNHLRATVVDKERADEIARLKGVLWPGMDIFDSATEQMKRKRNQKKDESILRMMENSSVCVEPTELIFSPTGILRKQRVISGNVDEDSSPLPGESPMPKRVFRPKRVLSQADPNAHYGQTERTKNSNDYGCHKQPETRRSARLSRGTAAAPHLLRLRDDHHSHRDDDDDDDFDLIFRGLDPRPRVGFSVFQDEPDTYDIDHQANESRFGSLFSRQDALPYSTFQSTSTQKPAFVSDKENIEPPLNVPDNWTSPITIRCHASDAAYPPEFSFGETQRVEFCPFGGHDLPIGYSYNPLAASLPKLQAEEDYIYFAGSHSSHEEPSVHEASPDATIPEVEEDEFERFCLNGSSH